jgi:diguanylate cyclase (GGDEF)-like protein
MVDLDAFKAYNDNYGHQAGDRALQQVAAVLTSSLRRQSDLVGRYGGEEFIVAMSQENEQEVRFVAERIRSGVEALRILHHLSPAGSVLTVSVGFFSAKVTEDKPLDLFIQQADQALYQAKAECGNLAREYSG